MRGALLLLLAVLVIGGGLGMLIARDPGYVLLVYGDWALETSVWLALALAVATVLLARLLVSLLLRGLTAPGRLAGWRQQRRGRRGQADALRGQLLLAEGRWRDAEKRLRAAAEGVAEPFVELVGAARAAAARGDLAAARELFAGAAAAGEGTRLPARLAEASCLQDLGHWRDAAALLTELGHRHPHHPHRLALLARCWVALEDWQAVAELLPELRRQKALDAAMLDELEEQARSAAAGSGQPSEGVGGHRSADADEPTQVERGA